MTFTDEPRYSGDVGNNNVTFVLVTSKSDEAVHPSPDPTRFTTTSTVPFPRVGCDAVSVKSVSVSLYKNAPASVNVIFKLNVGLVHKNVVV